MKLIVFGASGKTGHQVVRQALDRDHTVTAYVRNAERLSIERENIESDMLSVVEGEISDREALSQAVSGQDAVLSVLGVPLVGQPQKPVSVFSDTIAQILSAMKAQEVKRLLAVTSVGTNPDPDPDNPFFSEYIITPLFLKPLFDDMRRMEALITASGTDWTIVRPPQLLGGPARGDFRIAVGYTLPQGRQLTRADLASFMLDEAEQGKYIQQGVAIAY